ncbi:MAG: acetate kinase, partial [Desulfobacterales bacterium]|nr:acetate kinase [Desulfobacterales bacterium]
VISENTEEFSSEIKKKIKNHKHGLSLIVDLLVDKTSGVIRDVKEISAIGHRVVHGGEKFKTPTLIDDNVISAIKDNIPLAPLHNPPNLAGIEVARIIFPNSIQVAVFDTAFHQTLPSKAFLYALPYNLYKDKSVRRYGFHGTSHGYIAEKYSDNAGVPLDLLNLITIHLGNGSSMAAIKNGQCVDTTMGMTPLEGLVMGTRSGDIDPSLPFFLATYLKMNVTDIETLLNYESGLKGICGTNDMREILQRRDAGDKLADLAVQIYCYRIKKYIGAYYAVLERLDGIIFTAGVGENAPDIRELSCSGLTNIGIKIDSGRNYENRSDMREIQSEESEIKIMVIPTDEELKIAQETKKVLDQFK